jgi:hypothetical protein
MAQTSLIIGDTNWAVKEDSLLGYNVIQNKYLPIPIDTVRATTATRVNEQGLIEIVPRNLIEYSEQLDNAVWIRTNLTVTPNATTAPNGTLTAEKLIPTVTNDLHITESSVVSFVSGSTYTFSFYAKRAEDNFIQITASSSLLSTRANFNLLNGTLGFVDSGITATITPINNDWYRCTASFVAAATGNFRMVLCNIPASTSARFATFAGNGTSGVFVWGAQIDNGSVATEYFPTTNRLDIPRIDYTTGSAALLVEPQRSNLLTYSEQFDDASWAKTNMVIVANNTISPNGTNNADKATASLYPSTSLTKTNLLTAASYTSSIYVKADTVSTFRIDLVTGGFAAGSNCIFNLTTLATTITNYGATTGSTAKIESVGNGWYRCSLTVLATAAVYFNQFYPAANGSVFIWGAQLEAGSYPTSYIPTLASSVTRNADVISKTGISGLIGQTEGTIFLEADIQKRNASDFYIAISNGFSLGEAIYLNQPSSGNLNVLFRTGGLTPTINILSANWNAGNNKIAIAYNSTLGEVFINGVSKGTVALTGVPTCNQIALASRSDSPGGLIGAGPYKQAILFKTALSNTELAQLTTL